MQEIVQWQTELLPNLLPRDMVSKSGLTVWDLVGQSATETSFFPSTWVFPCRYHSTVAPYPYLNHLQSTT